MKLNKTKAVAPYFGGGGTLGYKWRRLMPPIHQFSVTVYPALRVQGLLVPSPAILGRKLDIMSSFEKFDLEPMRRDS